MCKNRVCDHGTVGCSLLRHGTVPVRCTSVDAWLEHGHGIYPNECTFYLHCLSSYADKIKIWMDDEHDVCFAFLTTVQ